MTGQRGEPQFSHNHSYLVEAMADVKDEDAHKIVETNMPKLFKV